MIYTELILKNQTTVPTPTSGFVSLYALGNEMYRKKSTGDAKRLLHYGDIDATVAKKVHTHGWSELSNIVSANSLTLDFSSQKYYRKYDLDGDKYDLTVSLSSTASHVVGHKVIFLIEHDGVNSVTFTSDFTILSNESGTAIGDGSIQVFECQYFTDNVLVKTYIL